MKTFASAIILIAVLIATARPAVAQQGKVYTERFGTRYVTGRAGLKPFDSGLTIAEDRVIVTTSKRQKGGLYVEAFSIPIASITSAEVTRERRDVAIGLFSGPGDHETRNYEFLTIVTEGPTGVEGLVFQVTQLEGPLIVAKINFAIKQLRAGNGDKP